MLSNKSFKKLRKLIQSPDMFFYDMFRKRIYNKSLQQQEIESELYQSPALDSAHHIEAENLKNVGLRTFIFSKLHAFYGARDSVDSNSIAIDINTLGTFLNIISLFKDIEEVTLKIFTTNGDYSVELSSSEKLQVTDVFHALLRRADFVIEISTALELLVWHIYLYDLSEDHILTFRSDRAWLRKISLAELCTAFQISPTRPIDAVYTWVNHADPTWQRYWSQCFPNESFDSDRYTSNDELRYSLRSLNKYAPWLNKIYIVSNCERPQWLNDSSRIAWIDHTEIFPDANDLPTFNSHAIEACLHRIPDLEEQFIYLNDDFILGQPCLPGDFFNEFGRSLSYFEPYGMISSAPPTDNDADYILASKRSRALIHQSFPDYEPRNLHRHFPYALKKSVIKEIEDRFYSAFTATRRSKLRSINDVNVTSFLYHHYAYAIGQTVQADAPGIIVRPSNIKKATGNDSYRYKFLCFNDGNGSSTDKQYKVLTSGFLNKRFPEKALWEL